MIITKGYPKIAKCDKFITIISKFLFETLYIISEAYKSE